MSGNATGAPGRVSLANAVSALAARPPGGKPFAELIARGTPAGTKSTSPGWNRWLEGPFRNVPYPLITT